MDQTLREYVRENRVRNPINITLTEKQIWNGVPIDDIISERNVRHFQNVVNRKVFGNAYQRYGRKLQSLIVREIGGSGRHHLHIMMETPNRLSPQCSLRSLGKAGYPPIMDMNKSTLKSHKLMKGKVGISTTL